jgi:hypothetical protein
VRGHGFCIHRKVRRARDLSATTSVETAVNILGNGSGISAQDTVPFVLWCAGERPDKRTGPLAYEQWIRGMSIRHALLSEALPHSMEAWKPFLQHGDRPGNHSQTGLLRTLISLEMMPCQAFYRREVSILPLLAISRGRIFVAFTAQSLIHSLSFSKHITDTGIVVCSVSAPCNSQQTPAKGFFVKFSNVGRASLHHNSRKQIGYTRLHLLERRQRIGGHIFSDLLAF